MQRNTTQKAFTLIEILVVIAIIAILAGVILAGTNILRARSRDTARQAALLEIQQGLSLYAGDNKGMYPVMNYGSQCALWGSLPATSVIPGLVSGGYIPSMPADPAMNASANQNCIIYWSNGTDYKVFDYNLIDSPNPGSEPTLIDPVRNYGRSWANPGSCIANYNSTRDPNISWAVWSGSTGMCS